MDRFYIEISVNITLKWKRRTCINTKRDILVFLHTPDLKSSKKGRTSKDVRSILNPVACGKYKISDVQRGSIFTSSVICRAKSVINQHLCLNQRC